MVRYGTALLTVIGCVAGWSGAEAVTINSTSLVDSSYKLVFDDEFNGASVDTTRWNVLANSWIGGGYSGDQFTPSNAAVADGYLQLSATRGSPSGRPYSAGFMLTKSSWQYGYFEERAKMPASGHGMWPAFWLNNNGNYPEIDVFEWIGNIPGTQWSTFHPVNDASLTYGVGLGTTVAGPDYSAAFHTYGMLWSPTSIKWYIDGVQTFQLTQGQIYKGAVVNIASTPMQVILNSAVGGWNNNYVDGSTVFPSTYMVDYVHIYSNNPNQAAVTPEPGYGGSPSILAPQCH